MIPIIRPPVELFALRFHQIVLVNGQMTSIPVISWASKLERLMIMTKASIGISYKHDCISPINYNEYLIRTVAE